MKIVLDTNILLQSIGYSSRFRLIWNAFLNEIFDLHVSTSILLEYEEQVAKKTSKQVAFNILALISEAPKVLFTLVYYEWNAIPADADINFLVRKSHKRQKIKDRVPGKAKGIITMKDNFDDPVPGFEKYGR